MAMLMMQEDAHDFAIFDANVIDKIFNKSAQLDGESILDFIAALCEISKRELMANADNPRIFSLQKIVEVAEQNMDRIKIVWNRIWSIIRDHFSQVGCH